MKELYDIKDRLMDELKDYGDKEMSAGNLQVVDTLTHSIKNLCKIIESEDGDYSGRYPYSYEGNRGSYARRRDSMGRYSRSDLTDRLRDLMSDAPDEHTRMEIKRLIEKMN